MSWAWGDRTQAGALGQMGGCVASWRGSPSTSPDLTSAVGPELGGCLPATWPEADTKGRYNWTLSTLPPRARHPSLA